MKYKQGVAVITAFAMIFSIAGFGLTSDIVDAASKKPKKIKLKATSKTVDIKGKVKVSVKSVSPKGASKAVTFKSSNKKIATVNSKGVVTGKRKGKVCITATSKKNKKVSKKITICVKQIKPKITMTKKATVYTGFTYKLNAKVGPVGVYNKGIKYSSANKKIATVNSKGVVTPKKAGKVVITASSKEKKKYKAKCTVTVRQSVTAIRFASSVLNMSVGDRKINSITINPSNAYSKAVTYVSSNPSVATVNNVGQVKAIATGSARITATAKYGLKTKKSYTVNVVPRKITPIVEDNIDTYLLDTSQFSSFTISGVNESGNEINMTVSPDDIGNIFGEGNIDFNWRNAISARDSFADAAFSYIAGSDYRFEKSDERVTVKTPNTITSDWYYIANKSFEPEDDTVNQSTNYTIKLYEQNVRDNPNLEGSYIELRRNGNTLTFGNSRNTISIKASDDGSVMDISLTRDGESPLELKLTKVSNGYTIGIGSDETDKYEIDITANKLR